jgi:hypothetical protein
MRVPRPLHSYHHHTPPPPSPPPLPPPPRTATTATVATTMATITVSGVGSAYPLDMSTLHHYEAQKNAVLGWGVHILWTCLPCIITKRKRSRCWGGECLSFGRVYPASLRSAKESGTGGGGAHHRVLLACPSSTLVTLAANLSVEIVSPRLNSLGLQLANIIVLAWPPRDSCSTVVSAELRYLCAGRRAVVVHMRASKRV